MISDDERRERNRATVRDARRLANQSRHDYDADATPIERPLIVPQAPSGGAKFLYMAIGMGLAALAGVVGVLFGGCPSP